MRRAKVKNHVYTIQEATTKALFLCNQSICDLYETQEARDKYREQYETIKELQQIVTNYVTKINSKL